MAEVIKCTCCGRRMSYHSACDAGIDLCQVCFWFDGDLEDVKKFAKKHPELLRKDGRISERKFYG